MTKTDERPTPDDGEGGICNVCGGGVRYGNRHSTCGAAVMRLERERDEARAQRDAAAVANCPALCIQFCAAYQEHRSVARLEAERDQLRVMWERDSKALGVALGHRDTARAVAEDNRALWSQCSQACATLQGERDALREANIECDRQLSRVLHELAGAASLCWKPKPSGVFDTTEAITEVERAITELRAILRKPEALLDREAT